jgi:tRNA dimethylallyltransferase
VKPKVIAMVGPTASGKTSIALRLAQELGGEIVGADSVQVYKGFDIGSAKPTAEDRRVAAHHLVDIVEPQYNFTAADFAARATQVIAEIRGREKVPLVVGGTGLYMRALFEGLMPAPGENSEVRQRLAGLPTEALRARLTAVDPAWAARIQGEDRFRLIRGLEIVEVSGKTPSTWAAEQKRDSPYEVLWIGLAPPREALYAAIERRVDSMWRGGWREEVARLDALGYGASRPMQSVGYAEVLRHLKEGVSEAETLQNIKRRTRQYAKRQLTWFRANPSVHWFDSLQTGTFDRIRLLIQEWW